jgi:dolichol-phosphate mannosyltransferase
MWTLAKKLKYFTDSMVAFSYAPMRAASLMGVLLSFLGGIYALVLVMLRVILGTTVEGWTSLMVAIVLLSGMQLIMMGILGEYLWRNLEETRRRPRFIIDRKIGIDAYEYPAGTERELDERNVTCPGPHGNRWDR